MHVILRMLSPSGRTLFVVVLWLASTLLGSLIAWLYFADQQSHRVDRMIFKLRRDGVDIEEIERLMDARRENNAGAEAKLGSLEVRLNHAQEEKVKPTDSQDQRKRIDSLSSKLEASKSREKEYATNYARLSGELAAARETIDRGRHLAMRRAQQLQRERELALDRHCGKWG